MKRFFKKLFKRGDFMTRADKAYYGHKFKTMFWSVFSLFIISWVGTNLVLCALATNVHSGGDLIYEAPKDVYLPAGQELNKAIKKSTSYGTNDYTIKTVTFGFSKDYSSVVSGVTPEAINTQNEIYLYRVNNGADIYVLSPNNMIANADCSYIFYLCYRLTQINFKNFDASKGNITNMSDMFYNCDDLTSLNLTSFNTSKVGSMNSLFYRCQNLVTLDLPSFETSNVTDMSSMFSSCKKLKSLNLRNFRTSNVTSMYGMFNGCNELVDLDITSFDTSLVKNMSNMFNGCSSLQALDLTSFKTSSIVYSSFGTGLTFMFRNCSNLETIYAVGSWENDNLNSTLNAGIYEGSEGMFYNCYKLVGGNGYAHGSLNIGGGQDHSKARVDGYDGKHGYFTAK